ncbi:hypothetical protein BKA66DRAFT_455872 [Pyrenochaeta sp. MPI-SDFR-AT-0127]|nr:hypothetical protein BKA66DRAFT_455872 [Pyrenochaeta sp. MPI-SDFR-AT-0127]
MSSQKPIAQEFFSEPCPGKSEPKHIIICCDDTSQLPINPHSIHTQSNIERLCQVIATTKKGQNGVSWKQLLYYSGTFDSGVLLYIEVYSFIACNYSPGDELSFFGFSRGAFIVRSLAGLICELGILESTSIDHFRRIYKIYQKKPAGIALKDSPEWRDYLIKEEEKDPLQFHKEKPVIRVIGVWDTVGSLGIPDTYWFDFFSVLQKKHKYQDTSLHNQIKNAFHALALDETSSTLTPILWQLPKDRNRHQSSLCQVWFPGTHIDVGGGNSGIMGPALSAQEHLANITFSWMIDMIQPYIAVRWDNVQKLLGRTEKGNNKGYAAGVISRLYGVPSNRTPSRYHDKERFLTCEYIHESVRRKQQRTQYNPTALKHWTLEQASHNEGQGYRWKWMNKTANLSLPELSSGLFGLSEAYGNGQGSSMATEISPYLAQVREREHWGSIVTTLRTTSGPESPEHEGPFWSDIRITPGNCGIQVLNALVTSMQDQAQNQDDPIVLVPGFSGWGRPLFGTINYRGGFEDLPAILAQAGYKVIIVRIGPMSSNRERACEIWRQLTSINNGIEKSYDRPNGSRTRIGINYGNQHPAERLGFLQGAWTWRPVLFGDIPENWNWTWGNERPVHFICHSHGGNSVRYLIEMLTGTHTDLFPGPDFPTGNYQHWVKSVVTIGTPHKGTTVTDVVQGLFPPDFLEVVTRIVWSTSFDPPESRFYDLQLDHWGFCRQQNESLTAMHTRLANLVPIWWNSNFHGLHDNSILGMANLNNFAPNPSPHTYYFTMSFCATEPFPDRIPNQQDVNDFFALFPLNCVINPFGLWGMVLATVLKAFLQPPSLVQLRDFVGWFTDVANRHLGAMNYFSRIPHPGSQIPRTDLLPAIILPAYAMGGYRLDQQRVHTLNGITSEKYQRNDGIVNTMSMSGPVKAIYGVHPFPGRGNDMETMDRAKGRYWHLGENVSIDHADQIGVFTAENTAIEVSFMYLLLASMVTRLK